MGVHFGCDMATYLNNGELTRVADTLKPPTFVGRYLPVYSVTEAEIAYLHARGGALLCIWNEDQNGSQMGGSYDSGHAAGERAAQAWKNIGVPSGIAVYLDVEQAFYVSGDYLAGFADGCASLGLVGGCYINSIAGNGHNASYAAARQRTGQPIPIFASEPQPFSLANQVATVWEPAAPDGYGNSVAVWQYCINYGSSDLDLCTDHGLAMMWGVKPPAPPKPTYPQDAHVIAPGMLKQAPSHASKSAIDPSHHDVYLEVGALVSVTAADAHTDDDWTPCSLVKPEQVVHGWFIAKNLKRG